MKYFVSIDGETVEVQVDGGHVTVGGRTVPVVFEEMAGLPLRYVVVNGQARVIPVERLEGDRWAITASGERWEVEVVDERTRHIRSLTSGGARGAAVGGLIAPMPGLVVRIEAEVGQTVAKGAGLVVLEAMKMENELKAAAPGVVKAILVKPGQAVEKGQRLIEIE